MKVAKFRFWISTRVAYHILFVLGTALHLAVSNTTRNWCWFVCFQIVFVFQAQYEPEITDFNKEVSLHGDFVKDVAFQVENLDYIFNYAKKQGAIVVQDLWEESDEFGVVRMAKIKTVSYN